MPSGIVKWFNAARGVGFIAPDDGGLDVFVHITAVQRAVLVELPEGASVTFDLILNHHGKPVADNVKVK